MRLISASTPTPDCPDGLDQPSAAQLGTSPRAATSRADGVSGRSTRRQAHWSATPMRPMPRTPACIGAVASRSVFAFMLQTCKPRCLPLSLATAPNLQQAAFAHFLSGLYNPHFLSGLYNHNGGSSVTKMLHGGCTCRSDSESSAAVASSRRMSRASWFRVKEPVSLMKP